MKINSDLVLLLLASPVYFARMCFRLWKRVKFWQMSYTPAITCRNCEAVISLLGIWRCRCGFTYKGHLLRVCPVCKTIPVQVRCYACGITEKLPKKI